METTVCTNCGRRVVKVLNFRSSGRDRVVHERTMSNLCSPNKLASDPTNIATPKDLDLMVTFPW